MPSGLMLPVVGSHANERMPSLVSLPTRIRRESSLGAALGAGSAAAVTATAARPATKPRREREACGEVARVSEGAGDSVGVCMSTAIVADWGSAAPEASLGSSRESTLQVECRRSGNLIQLDFGDDAEYVPRQTLEALGAADASDLRTLIRVGGRIDVCHYRDYREGWRKGCASSARGRQAGARRCAEREQRSVLGAARMQSCGCRD